MSASRGDAVMEGGRLRRCVTLGCGEHVGAAGAAERLDLAHPAAAQAWAQEGPRVPCAPPCRAPRSCPRTVLSAWPPCDPTHDSR